MTNLWFSEGIDIGAQVAVQLRNLVMTDNFPYNNNITVQDLNIWIGPAEPGANPCGPSLS